MVHARQRHLELKLIINMQDHTVILQENLFQIQNLMTIHLNYGIWEVIIKDYHKMLLQEMVHC